MINIICASTGENLKLAKRVQELLSDTKTKNTLIILEEFNLPLYTSKIEESLGVPDEAIELAEQLKNGNGVILIAPEYNGSIPPILNNAIAWVSRTEADWRSAFNEKFALVMSHSGGGGMKVINAMKQQLEHLGCNTFARTFTSNSSKEINEKALKKALNIFSQVIGE